VFEEQFVEEKRDSLVDIKPIEQSYGCVQVIANSILHYTLLTIVAFHVMQSLSTRSHATPS